MSVDNYNTTVLQNSAYLELDASTQARFSSLAKKITDWDELIKQAESSGLSNILYSHLNRCKISIPDTQSISFKALTARHRRLNRERTDALAEILDAFSEHNIDTVLLKGMALIQTLYTENAQRPMGDIDILVKSSQALLAQQTLRDIGYNAGDRKTGYLFDHHHLPIASKSINGLSVQVEIHHDALSGDSTSSMTYDTVCNEKITVSINGRSSSTMGHIHMLKHLCHHTFEPCDTIKLGAIADIYGYAEKYFNEIDWGQINLNYYLIHNTLRCLHFVTPLPEVLAKKLIAPTCEPPAGVSKGFPMLSSTFSPRWSPRQKFQRLFMCSGWWLHIFYVTPPENSLLSVRLFRHPAQVMFWLYRRLLAKFKSRLNKQG